MNMMIDKNKCYFRKMISKPGFINKVTIIQKHSGTL